jgi:hypothetical protein
VGGGAEAPPAAPQFAPERIPNGDPGPPLAITVDTLRVKEDGSFRLAGRLRNDGEETYQAVGVVASFVDDQGIEHGPVHVFAPCPYLEPGTTCPFSLEIYGRDYVAYRLQPTGALAGYGQPATLTLSGVTVANDGIGNVRFTGTVTNENPFAVGRATIGGALIDGGGGVLSAGSTLVLGELAPGESRSFDLRVEYVPYDHYRLTAQGEQ